MESPRPLGLVRESYLKTEVEAWISRYVKLYYITTWPRDITKLYRDIRITGDIWERTPYRKTLIDSYSKLKTRTIKN